MRASLLLSCVSLLALATPATRAASLHEFLHFTHVQGGVAHGLSFISASEGWTCEDGGRIRHWTKSPGGAWSFEYQFTPYECRFLLRDIYFTDALHGWALGYGGRVVRTENGGVTWENPLDPGAPGGPFVLKPGSTTELADLYAIRFVWDTTLNDWHGWLTGFEGVFMESLDGGETWLELPSPAPIAGTDLYGLQVLPGLPGQFTVLVCGDHGLVARSRDNGHNWTVIHSLTAPVCTGAPTNLELWDIEVGANGVGYVGGGFGGTCGHVFRTSDFGTNWTLETCFGPPSAFATVYGLTRAGTPDAMTAGYGNQIKVRETGGSGACWNDYTYSHPGGFGNPPLRGAAGFGAHDVWVDGLFNVVRHSADGGQTWSNIGGKHYLRLEAADFTSAQTGCVGGQGHRIMRTVNGAYDWVQAYALVDSLPNDAGFVTGIAFSAANPLNGVAVGDKDLLGRPFIAYTSDGGANWTRTSNANIPAGTQHLRELNFRPGSALEVWTVGPAGRVLRSLDGGVTWASKSLGGLGPHPNLEAITFDGTGRIFVVGSDPAGAPTAARYSANDGLSWNPVNLKDAAGAAIEVNLNDVACSASSASSSIWAVGDGAKAMKYDAATNAFMQVVPTVQLYEPDEDFTCVTTFDLSTGENTVIGGINGAVLFTNGWVWTLPKSQLGGGEAPLTMAAISVFVEPEDLFRGIAVGRQFAMATFVGPGL